MCVRVSNRQYVRRSEYSGSVNKETKKLKPRSEVNNMWFFKYDKIVVKCNYLSVLMCKVWYF